MTDNIIINNKINNSIKDTSLEPLLKNKVDFKESEKEAEQQLNESRISSTSYSSSYRSNEDSIEETKNPVKNFEKIGQNSIPRKGSAPAAFPQHFVMNINKVKEKTRIGYLTKLMNKGILSSEEKRFKCNNIFIFDWDDTLLCTTVLTPCGFFDDNMIVLPSKMEKIKQLEILVKSLLTKAVEKGDCYIITNSEPGWVGYSCRRFFPDTFELLKKIKIISARELYEGEFPEDIKAWKNNAFKDIIQNYERNLPTNIVCMGDSLFELEAAHGLAEEFPNGYIKAIKFMEYPKIEELISQLKLVLDKFNFIYSACKNWTITVDKKKKKSNRPN